MAVALWFLAGAAVALGLWLALEPTWRQPLFARRNFRGRDVPTAGGVAAVLAVVACLAAVAVFEDSRLPGDLVATLVAVVGFGLLGALDDLAGDDDRKGFRGHLAALARGRLTTGGLKLAGGLAVAAVAVGAMGRAEPADILIVAAAANLGNLLDRAPGRVAKVAIAAFLALSLPGDADMVDGPALAVGAVAGLAPFDLKERLMLGDAGANAVGAALGIGLVQQTEASGAASLIAVAALVGLNLLSELVSFSRVIAAVPPLRWLDELGRAKVAG